VATVYRDLRRSLEAKADEPGAADFYYGEMEMRRHSETAGLAERAIVTVYWLSSGYGLRASRAFAWLALLIVVAGIVLAAAGFNTGRPDFWTGILYCLRAPLPWVQSDEKQLTTLGLVVDAVVRILAPVLFGLWLLGLRGRVKR
jgi:hypothetical protein